VNVGKVAASRGTGVRDVIASGQRGGALFDPRRSLLQCTIRHPSILLAFLPNGTRFMQEQIFGKA
jgi:hypothetical protein